MSNFEPGIELDPVEDYGDDAVHDGETQFMERTAPAMPSHSQAENAFDAREWRRNEFYTLAKNEWPGWRFDEGAILRNNVKFDERYVGDRLEKFAIVNNKAVQLTRDGGKLYAPGRVAKNAIDAEIANGNGFVRDFLGVMHYGESEYGTAAKPKLTPQVEAAAINVRQTTPAAPESIELQDLSGTVDRVSESVENLAT